MSAILFTNAAVFDGVGPELRGGSQVLVADGRIQAVSDKAIKPPADCQTLDLAGQTLMPGLIDAHVHIWASDLDIVKLVTRKTEYLAAFAYRSLAGMLDRGFTTVRDLGGAPPDLAEAIEAGLAAAPPLIPCGKALSKTDLSIDDLALFEMNEAFAAVSIASARDLGVSLDVVNVNGGAIALGHPIGMSGNRLALTLLHELRRRGGGFGAVALCGGGGQGDALILRVAAP